MLFVAIKFGGGEGVGAKLKQDPLIWGLVIFDILRDDFSRTIDLRGRETQCKRHKFVLSLTVHDEKVEGQLVWKLH